MKLSEIKANPNNPRIIKDQAFKKLVKSIQEFPKMMELRPMVVNADGVVLGGNMRLKALKELGFVEIPDGWVKRADQLTDDEIRRFIVLDNVGFGEWDTALLLEGWQQEELEDWGVELEWPVDYSEKNQEINTADFEDVMELNLKFKSDDYWIVKNYLENIAETPEQALIQICNNEPQISIQVES